MDVQLPDGTLLQGVPDGTTRAQLVQKLQANGRTVPQEWLAPKSKDITASDVAGGVLEPAAQIATGLVGSVAGGLSGIGQGAYNLYRQATGQPEGMSAADRVRQVQGDLTYQPKTAGGQAVSNVVNYLPNKYSQFADWAGGKASDLSGSPLLGAALNTGIQALPMIAGAKLARQSPRVAPPLSPEVSSAVGAGLKLTPEEAQSGMMGRIAQSLSGSAKLERTMSRANAPTLNDLGAAELGIPDLKPASIAQAKSPANAVYSQVAKVGPVPVDAQFKAAVSGIANPGGGSFAFDVPPSIARLKTGYGRLAAFDSADAVAKVRQLRAEAGKNIKAPNAPEQNALGYAQRQVAEAIDNQLDRHIQANSQSLGLPANLIDQFRDARVQLAKIHSIEDAMDGSNLSAAALDKQAQRKVPLSGNLRTIANAHQNFPRSLQDVSSIRNSGPFGALDLLFGGAAGLHNPAMASAILARPITRSVLTSPLYQSVGIGGKPLFGAPSPSLVGGLKALPLLEQQQQRGLLQ